MNGPIVAWLAALLAACLCIMNVAFYVATGSYFSLFGAIFCAACGVGDVVMALRWPS